MTSPHVQAFFDEPTNTASYVVTDPETKACAVVDSVLDFDSAAGRTSTVSADQIIAYVQDNNLKCEWLLETHVHADHLSAAPYIQQRLGGKLAIGDGITRIQDVFGKIFNAGTEFERDGSQFDRLLKDQDEFAIGALSVNAMHTPGHTPACMTYVIGDCAFVGDTLFMPDFGTARADFPGGDARQLYRSIRKVLSLPSETKLYMCHDYKAPGRDEYAWQTTVAEERANNVACPRWHKRRRVCRHARSAGCSAGHAKADRAIHPGQHAGGSHAGTGRQWRCIPENPLESAVTHVFKPALCPDSSDWPGRVPA